MKCKVLIDFDISIDPPSYLWYVGFDREYQAKVLEKWSKSLEDFIRDHRSQDAIHINVNRKYQDQCSYCKNEWEEDEDGPLCCQKAQDEWTLSKTQSNACKQS